MEDYSCDVSIKFILKKWWLPIDENKTTRLMNHVSMLIYSIICDFVRNRLDKADYKL